MKVKIDFNELASKMELKFNDLDHKFALSNEDTFEAYRETRGWAEELAKHLADTDKKTQSEFEVTIDAKPEPIEVPDYIAKFLSFLLDPMRELNSNCSEAERMVHWLGAPPTQCVKAVQWINHSYYNFMDFLAAYQFGWKVNKEKKYYIHFLKDDSDSYLNVSHENPWDSLNWSIDDETHWGDDRTQFTMDEIEEHFPQFKPFAELVEKEGE